MPSTIDEMQAVIIDALKTGEFSQRQIDRLGKGTRAGKLLKDEHVTDAAIEYMYGNLLALRSKPTLSIAKSIAELTAIEQSQSIVASIEVSAIDKQSIAETKAIDTAIDNQSSAIDELAKLRAQVERLENENCQLKSRVEKLETSMAEKPIAPSIANTAAIDRKTVKEIKGGNVLGWSLFRDKGDRWYAIRRIDGQNRSVYIGRDKGKAEEKIKHWESVYSPSAETAVSVSATPMAVGDSFDRFLTELREVTNGLHRPFDTGLYRIWEIRAAMADWPPSVFDAYLKRIDQERIGYLRIHDVPGELKESERALSLVGDRGETWFYLVWAGDTLPR